MQMAIINIYKSLSILCFHSVLPQEKLIYQAIFT